MDVFLVLSGFLMTRNIANKIEADSFSLSAFYISRFWRLYPASLITILASSVLSMFVLRPNLVFRLAESSVPSLFAMSNFYFLSQDNYFDVSAGEKPLLHLWSLSLEEQYYALWPSLLLLLGNSIRRRTRVAGLVLVIMTVSSFLFSICTSIACRRSPFSCFHAECSSLELVVSPTSMRVVYLRKHATSVAGLTRIDGIRTRWEQSAW